MKDGFIKVAAGTPNIRVADCDYNAGQIIALMKEAAAQGVKVLALPELCVTGYTCGDLFLQPTLLDGAERAMRRILEETAELELLAAVGMPVRAGGKLFNCAVVVQKGSILAIVPKTYLPSYGEFYETRWFHLCDRDWDETLIPRGSQMDFGNYGSVGQALIRFPDMPDLTIGVEICEDLWAADPPSRRLAEAGATLILNLSASDELAGKAAYRRQLVLSQSARLCCGYVYADAGEGESTTDLVFAGHNMIAESGTMLAEKRFATGLIVSEIDVQRLAYERRRLTSFPLISHAERLYWDEAEITLSDTSLTRPKSPTPIIPAD